MNRYYDPARGRFTTPDPYESSGHPQNPLSWNRYAYVTGDPINMNDPTGLEGSNDDDENGDRAMPEGPFWGSMPVAPLPTPNCDRGRPDVSQRKGRPGVSLRASY